MPLRRSQLDPRDMKAAYVVSDENGYYDSQNIISVFDKSLGQWVLSCVLHHSRNHEGGAGLTLCSTRSEDGGRTWSSLRPIEEPETELDCLAYGVEKKDYKARQSHDGYQLLVGERIYLFYGWNVGSQPPVGEQIPRTDMQLDEGFWMRWSDDYGATFSGGRVLIPVRRTEIDRTNPWEGRTMGAFCCDKPTVVDGRVYFAFQKTCDGNGESYGSEVFFMRSADLLRLDSEGRPEDAAWETLPRGETGLYTMRGLRLGEEPHLLHLGGPRLLCVWRTELGFLDTSLSLDYGDTWSRGGGRGRPCPLTYTCPPSVPDTCGHVEGDKRLVQTVAGAVTRNTELITESEEYRGSGEYRELVISNHDVVRNVRGAFTPHKLRDGSILLLFYNNGHTDKLGYCGRLVVWVMLGQPEGAGVTWTQPEVAIWWDGIQLDNRDDWNEDWAIVDGAGYHDIQELEDGRVVFVESNKLTVRFHTIDPYTIECLKNNLRSVSPPGDLLTEAVFSWTRRSGEAVDSGLLRAPVLPDLRSGAGFTIVLWADLGAMGQTPVTLVDGLSRVSGSLDEEAAEDIEKGFKLEIVDRGSVRLTITDGFGVDFEFLIEGLNSDDLKRHYALSDGSNVKLCFILDGGPKVCSCVINNKLYNPTPSGWRFLPREFGEIGGSQVRIKSERVSRMAVFDRVLLSNECSQLI